MLEVYETLIQHSAVAQVQTALVLLCFVCLFDLACFFPPSFSSLIETCIHVVYTYIVVLTRYMNIARAA